MQPTDVNKIKISVIICSNKRKEYIIQAAMSANNQTMPRDEYEIIIVKNFKDNLIDDELRKLSNSVINVDSEWQGEKWWTGIIEAKGKVLCFLDDDDLFSAAKLKTVWENYSKFKFQYYRDNIKPFKYVPLDYSSQEHQGILNLNKGFSIPKKIRLISKNISRTSSSGVSVEKDFLLKFESGIRKVKIAFDVFIFYAALENNSQIILDRNVMTYYRLHDSYTGISENNFIESAGKISKSLNVFSDDYCNIGLFVKNKALRHYLVNDLFLLSFSKYLFLHDGKPGIRDVIHFVFCPSPGRKRFKLFYLVLYFVSFFSIEKAKRMYVKYISLSRM